MKIATTIAEVRAQVAAWKKEGLTVGLVPTMGYLHEGHASLVDKAVSLCDRVVVMRQGKIVEEERRTRCSTGPGRSIPSCSLPPGPQGRS